MAWRVREVRHGGKLACPLRLIPEKQQYKEITERTSMRYHNITKDDMRNGDGLRAVLWVAGCSHGCKGCHNPITWDICGGIPFDEAAKAELFEALKPSYISGITFSGGDPLHEKNREETGALIEEIKETFPEKTIWVYTGFLWEEIRDLPCMKKVDVVVDGPFIEELKDNTLHWKGSSNQRVIDVQKTLAEGKVVLHDTRFGRMARLQRNEISKAFDCGRGNINAERPFPS